MKKLLYIFAAFAIAFSAQSCKSETPLFDFQTEATVFDQATNIDFAGQAEVRNVVKGYLIQEDVAVPTTKQAIKDRKKADKWLDKKVAKWVKDNNLEGTQWQLHIKGYLKYIVTIEIDETYPEE